MKKLITIAVVFLMAMPLFSNAENTKKSEEAQFIEYNQFIDSLKNEGYKVLPEIFVSSNPADSIKMNREMREPRMHQRHDKQFDPKKHDEKCQKQHLRNHDKQFDKKDPRNHCKQFEPKNHEPKIN